MNNYMHNFLANFILSLQKVCIELSPQSSPYSAVYMGLICNQSPKPSLLFVELKRTGLFHLIIISGSHLLYIEKVLGFITKRFGIYGLWLSHLFVTAYTLMCGFSPPVTRCWMGLSLKHALSREAIPVTSVHTTFISGLLTLALFPNWIHSASFLLSWCASLFVSFHVKNGMAKQFVIYAGLLPVFYAFQVTSPLTALINWGAAPLIGFILLPACFFTYLIPALQPITDFLIGGLAQIISGLSREINVGPGANDRFSYLFCWGYLLVAHILIHQYSVHKKRQEILT